jgi:hypothetical protein
LPDQDQEGLPLSDAIRRFADPDKWRRYDQAATAARGRVRTRLMSAGGEPIAGWGAAEQARHDNHLLDRRDQAWRGLQRDFLGRLRSGELVASGYQASPTMRRSRPVTGREPELSERQLHARQRVQKALEALGGLSSPAGSCVWHVVEWAMRQGWGERPVRQEQAQGILVAALGMLTAHVGYGEARRAS